MNDFLWVTEGVALPVNVTTSGAGPEATLALAEQARVQVVPETTTRPVFSQLCPSIVVVSDQSKVPGVV